MPTRIYDRRGNPAPTLTAQEIRQRPGRFWKLTEQRGAVGISQHGETVAVALSLDQFVSILFGIQTRPRRKKRKLRGSMPKKHGLTKIR
jgi:hypothetical protein